MLIILVPGLSVVLIILVLGVSVGSVRPSRCTSASSSSFIIGVRMRAWHQVTAKRKEEEAERAQKETKEQFEQADTKTLNLM